MISVRVLYEFEAKPKQEQKKRLNEEQNLQNSNEVNTQTGMEMTTQPGEMRCSCVRMKEIRW